MAHIDRRNRGGTIRYVARYVDPAGRERSKSFTRKADAQKYLTEVEAAKLKGIWVDPKHGRTLFRDWHAEWWPTLFPALAIASCIVAINLIADALQSVASE